MTPPQPSSRRSSPLGTLLQQWRQVRRMSQLALAIEADVSPRHVCFIGICLPPQCRLSLAFDPP